MEEFIFVGECRNSCVLLFLITFFLNSVGSNAFKVASTYISNTTDFKIIFTFFFFFIICDTLGILNR